jgi:hypothetical protein
MTPEPSDDVDRLLERADRDDRVPPFDASRFEGLLDRALVSDAEGDAELLPQYVDDGGDARRASAPPRRRAR